MTASAPSLPPAPSLLVVVPLLLLVVLRAAPASAQPPFPSPSGVPAAQSQLLTRPLSQRPVRNATGSQCDTDLSLCSAPTSVYVTISMNKQDPVQEQDGAFYCDFYVNLAWRDDRFLNFADANSFAFDPSWWNPQPELMNLISASQDIQYPQNDGWVFSAQQGVFAWVDSKSASAEPAGAVWVMGVVRVSATLAVRVDLHDFPYDSQTAEIQVESSSHDSTELVWVPSGSINEGILVNGPGITRKNAINGWTVTGVGAAANGHYYPTVGQTFSRLAVVAHVERQSMFWTMRIVLGMVLYTLMSILTIASSASLDPILRFAVVGGFFVGMVGWQYVLVSLTPVLGYNTRLDTFVYMNFIVCFIVYSYLCFMACWHKTILYATGHIVPDYDPEPEEEKAEKGETAAAEAGAEKEAGKSAGAEHEQGLGHRHARSHSHEQNDGAVSVRDAAGTITKVGMLQAAAAAGAASVAVPLPSWHRGRVSTLADACFHKQRRGPCWGWKLCWSGSWAGLPLHRKIDLVFGVVTFVIYIIATSVILMGGLGFNLNECQQGVNCN